MAALISNPSDIVRSNQEVQFAIFRRDPILRDYTNPELVDELREHIIEDMRDGITPLMVRAWLR